MIKILIKILPIFLLLPVFCGCLPENESNSPCEISNIIDAQDGFYVVTDEICYPVIRPEELSNELLVNLYAQSEVSFTLPPQDRESLPEIGEGSSLILKCSTNMESPIIIVPLRDDGFSLGIKLTQDQNSFHLKETDGVVEGSQSKEILDNITGLNSGRILSVGGSILKSDSVNFGGLIKNLNQDSNYDVAFFKGTIETKVTLPADTQVLTLVSGENQIQPELKYTEDGYGMCISDELTPGYYLVILPESMKTLGGIFKVVE